MLNKALKLTVISAVLITSGFAQQQATISGDVTNNDTFEIGNGVTVAIADGATIHNYGNIKGSGEIDGTTAATIINYNHIVEATEADPNCFRPTGGGSVEGTINKTNVTVTDQKADITVSFSDSNKVGNTILLTTDSCDTTDADKVLNMTNDGDAIDVLANIANELNGSGVSHSLNIQGKFVLTGDQSRFNEAGTNLNVNDGSVDIATDKAFPQTEVNVNNGSELNINAPGIVTASKDVTVTGSQLNIGKTSTLKLSKGVTLWFKGPLPPWVVKAGTPGLADITWDNPATWLLLERTAPEKDSDLFALKVDEGNNKIGIMKTTINIGTPTRPDTPINNLSDVTVGNTAAIKGTVATGYTADLHSDTDNVLKEINDLLTAGGTWKTLKEYSKEKLMPTIRANYATDLQYDASEPKITGKNGSPTNVVIPYGVTEIGDDAFFYCAELKNITIPNSVIEIRYNAFQGAGLTSITIPNSVTSIENGAFNMCSSLTQISIPSSVTSIGNSAFSGCTSLASITFSEPSSVTSIGNTAFNRCTSLASITIPNSVTSIGNEAFFGTAITSITIPAFVTEIGDDAFKDTGLTSITFSEPSSMTTIGQNAFYNCANLINVAIPNTVNSIGYCAFYGTAITSMEWPSSATTIPEGVFCNCHKLASITIPNTVTSIERSAFTLTTIAHITIPASVTSIGAMAFSGDTGLKTVTFLGTVNTLGNSLFSNCTSLQSITLPKTWADDIGGEAAVRTKFNVDSTVTINIT